MEQTVEERLLTIESNLMTLIRKIDELRQSWEKLEMAKRQANLMEVDAQERALSIGPITTAMARKQAKEQYRG